jgi:MFS family permease
VPLRQRGARAAGWRLLRASLYALLLASSGLQWAVVPILPVYAHRFGLSGAQQGMLLGATGLATLLISLPAGGLSDRFGARRLTVAACALMTAALLGQAAAPSFSVLLGARFAFGAGYGVLWTAGLAWLADSAPGRRGHAALGGSVAVSGTGTIAGPAVSGWLVQYLGLRVPFFAAAVLLALLTAVLGLLPLAAPAAVSGDRAVAALRAVAREPCAVAAVAAIMTAGFTSGVSSLLVPDEMHAAGAAPAAVGLAFSAASALFVVASGITAAAGRRAVRVRTAGLGMLLVTVALTPAVLSTAPMAMLAMLCATTAARAMLWTVSYPLGAAGAQRSGAGVGMVMGLLNGVWAAMAVLGPVAAGFGLDHLSARPVFALTQAASAAVLGSTAIYTARLRRARAGLSGGPARAGQPHRPPVVQGGQPAATATRGSRGYRVPQWRRGLPAARPKRQPPPGQWTGP